MTAQNERSINTIISTKEVMRYDVVQKGIYGTTYRNNWKTMFLLSMHITCMFTSAPRWTSKLTMSSWPFRRAKYKAVAPF